MNFFKRKWTDSERWVMGILAALIVSYITWMSGYIWGSGQLITTPKTGDKYQCSAGSKLSAMEKDGRLYERDFPADVTITVGDRDEKVHPGGWDTIKVRVNTQNYVFYISDFQLVCK